MPDLAAASEAYVGLQISHESLLEDVQEMKTEASRRERCCEALRELVKIQEAAIGQLKDQSTLRRASVEMMKRITIRARDAATLRHLQMWRDTWRKEMTVMAKAQADAIAQLGRARVEELQLEL